MAYNLTGVNSPSTASTATSFSSTLSAANFGNALSLNGSTQYCTAAPAAFQFAAGTSWTIHGRFRSTSATGTQLIAALGKTAAPSSTDAWWVGTIGGVLKASLSGFNAATAFGTASVADSNWHEFELVVTSGTSATLYVDGTAAGTQAGTWPGVGNSDTATVGAFFPNGGINYWFTGQIDEIAAFTNAQHSSNYTAATTPIAGSAANLQVLWHFDGNLNDSKTTAPTSATLTGPTTGVTNIASSNFTITLDNPAVSTITFTPAGTVGTNTFSPSAPQITAGNSSVTFTDTASSDGTHVVTITNNGSLSNVGSISYVTTTVVYTRVNATDTIGGQNIMILVPNVNATIPYNAANPTGVIMYSHGRSEVESGLLDDSLKAACVTAFLNAGYLMCGTNARGNNFGVQQSVDDYAALDKYMRDNYNVSNVLIWAQSMGGLTGLLLLAQNKVKGVVGWLGTYPMVNLSAADNGTGGTNYATDINTAFGITGVGISTYANKTYGNDPCLLPGSAFRNVPMRFYASASDTVVGKTQNTDTLRALIAEYCRESTVVVCSGTHGDPSHFVASEYTAFAARCFANPAAGYKEERPWHRTRQLSLAKMRY